MAIITISRQVAALGDEIASKTAEKLQYRFINRKMIEKRIVELGFPEEKLQKYDEKKPGFFASLVKDRDEYLGYLQTAVLEAASEGNCILIGRGAFIILEQLVNHVALRFVADDDVRLRRLQKEFSWNEKQAAQRISESDTNRLGFHKSFFNLANEDPCHFHMVFNTGLLDEELVSDFIVSFVHRYITKEKEIAGKKKLEELLKAQHLVNYLIFDCNLDVDFLHAVIDGKTIILQGLSDSSASIEKVVVCASKKMPGYKIESAINVVQDFRAYR
ncbi:MAG: cytidylate kinase-like family protein [Treponema sp.]|nr:cytidylate kinase-like family protein [Treponema sp.]